MRRFRSTSRSSRRSRGPLPCASCSAIWAASGTIATTRSPAPATTSIARIRCASSPSDPLVQEPGTRYLYSTYGYNLLGAAVELVSGMPFAEYLQTHIFRPAAMEETRDDNVYALIPHRSRGYALAGNGQIINCGLADTSNKIPGGGLIAPAADLVRFGMSLMEDKLVRSQNVDLMLTSQTTREGRTTGYGMGFSVGVSNGRRFASHSGGQQGTSTFLVLYPSERLALAVMVNRESAPAVGLADQIAAVLFEP